MKVISKKNECYVQGEDLDYLLYNETLNDECKIEINKLLNLNKLDEYIKIKDEALKCEILQNENILSFAKLYNMPIEKLCSLEFKLLIDILNFETSPYDGINDDREKERKRISNLRKQINQMILYKLKKSKCNFPNIDNPCKEDVICEKYSACLSLDYDNILVHSLDNNKIDENEVNSFCDVAYKLIMRDKMFDEDENDVELEIKDTGDGETLSISKKDNKNRKEYKIQSKTKK